MNVKSIKSSVIAVMSAAAGVIVSTTAFAVERPELRAYPYKTSVTEGGTYANESTVGTDFVVSGTISSALTFSSDVPYRVTLDGGGSLRDNYSCRRRDAVACRRQRHRDYGGAGYRLRD